MNINAGSIMGQGDKPLAREDIENLLHDVGSADKLELIGLNLRGINLVGFDLGKANLHRANLSGANLSGINLSRADLSGANLSGTSLRGADLFEANLNKADLNKADLRGAILSNAILREANLSGTDLRGVDLRRADLSGADLNKADLNRTDLFEANLNRAIFSNSDLSGTDLSRVSLSSVDLRGAIFNRGTFSKANLSKIISREASDLAAQVTPSIATAESISAFRIRIMEEPLTPYNLTLIISAITDLATKCWLIANRQLSDLVVYMQTHDVRFIKQSQLIITRITYNSPFDASFNIDQTATNLAEAITTMINGAMQIKQSFEVVEIENTAQDIELAKQKSDQASKAVLLEQERQELAIERERLEVLEKRLEVQKKGIEYALEIADKTVTMLRPNVDEETKALIIQTLLPTILQLQNGKGLELVLPIQFKRQK